MSMKDYYSRFEILEGDLKNLEEFLQYQQVLIASRELRSISGMKGEKKLFLITKVNVKLNTSNVLFLINVNGEDVAIFDRFETAVKEFNNLEFNKL